MSVRNTTEAQVKVQELWPKINRNYNKYQIVEFKIRRNYV